MKKLLFVVGIASTFLFSSFNLRESFKGNWVYEGGMSNGKFEGATKEYALQRKYNDTSFEAVVIEKGSKPERYERGSYRLMGDTCLETQTWCSQPSQLLNKTVSYTYQLRNDTLSLKATLPNGIKVEEFWRRVSRR